MGRIYDGFLNFFKQDDWPYQEIEGRPLIRTGFAGKNGEWVCFAQAREDMEQFVFYSIAPIKAPVEKRDAVVEFITRANYGMIIGNFEFDYSDGEIRYKTALDVEGGEATFTMLKNLIYINVRTMDRYLPGLMKVIYGDVSPAEAIREIEG